jgi:hypothetical protein
MAQITQVVSGRKYDVRSSGCSAQLSVLSAFVHVFAYENVRKSAKKRQFSNSETMIGGR